MGKTLLISTLIIIMLNGFHDPEADVNDKLIVSKSANQTVLVSDIEYKDGIYLYEKKVFNGNIIAYYQNKTLKFKCEVFDGRLHGITTEYYPSGKVKGERNFYLGRLFGKFTEYFENGDKRIDGQVRDINYHGGEEIENLMIAKFKKGKAKPRQIGKGKIIFIKESGQHFRSSEEVPIYQQNKYIITTLDEKKTLLEIK